MFAVIKTGGKQYNVAENDELKIEKIDGNVGDMVTFDQVLLVGGDGAPVIGAPVVEGASVAAEIINQGRGRKIIIFKKRRRQNSRRRNGHRQYLTTVKITEILTDGKKASAKKAAPKKEASKADAKKAEAETPAPLFSTPEGDKDDLKKISGVGPVLEGKLNALGITKFEQIANFSADEIAKVDEVLNFKGRIEREDWIAQAKDLAGA